VDPIKAIEELTAKMTSFAADFAEYRKLSDEKQAQLEKSGKVSDELTAKMVEYEARFEKAKADSEELKTLQSRVSEMEASGQRPGQTREDPSKPFKSFGEFLCAVVKAEDRMSAPDPRLLQIKAGTGLSEGVPADGGFLVQQDFVATILQRTYEIGGLLSRVQRIPISTNSNGIKINAINETSRAAGSRYGGVQTFWLDEAGTKTASHPTFRQIELNLKKLAALVYATDELLQDAGALQSILMQILPEEINFVTENAIIRGTGVGQPLGILNSGARVTQAAEAAQAANTIVFENIINMWSRMYARSRSNAVWLINQDCEPQLMAMSLAVGAGGVPVYMPAGGINGAPYSTLMGRPVIATEYNSTLGTEGDIILVDPSQYLMIDKGGIQSASSIHVRFVNDETVFRFVYRVDGQPTWNAPLTPAQGTVTQSPYVTLATRP